ncbi:unnamed protein product [Soboliphyme baturini]|uniref:Mediator of RNA polymerase II transcription subunit 7 n=1 Tax=Soboliphyme baturini TaxID=241478 RepID=A0A183JA85_9BILA|nr:unnamed protein product [Soboliphyme baturini]
MNDDFIGGLKTGLHEMPPLEPGMMPPTGGDPCFALGEFAKRTLQRPIMYDSLNHYNRKSLMNALETLIKVMTCLTSV